MTHQELEWWPDNGGALLWHGGSPVALDTLPLEDGLRERLAAWVAEYADDRLPFDGIGDADWVRSGQQLLAEVRAALRSTHLVDVEEPWWELGTDS